MPPNKKILLPFVGLVVLAALAVGYFYFSKTKKSEPGAVETAKEVSQAVPEIQTNPGENVPEINPLDRANPFKYENPLR